MNESEKSIVVICEWAENIVRVLTDMKIAKV